MSCLETVRNDFRRIVLDSLGELVSSGVIPPEPLPYFDIRLCDSKFGNLTCNAALVSAAALGISAEKLAVLICDTADLYGSCISDISSTTNGYINICVSDIIFGENAYDNAPITSDSYTAYCADNSDGLDALKAAVNADCFCRLVNFCGGKAVYLGESFEKYGVISGIEEIGKKLVFGTKSRFGEDINEKNIVRLNDIRIVRNNKKTLTHRNQPITQETLTDELTADAVRYFFVLDEAVIDLDAAYSETPQNPYFATEKACLLCNRAITRGMVTERLSDYDKNIILLADTINDTLRQSLYKRTAKPLCELAANVSRGFTEHYYRSFSADTRTAKAVLQTLEIILGILGISVPKKI